MKLLPIAFTALLLCGSVQAQTASFRSFGQGCAAASQRVCASANSTASSLQNLFFSQTSEVAIPLRASTAMRIRGFEILTRATRGATNVTAHIYLASASTGAPLTTPAISGTMRVGTTIAWYRVTFSRDLIVRNGQTVFLSWTDPRVPFSQVIQWPVPTSGTRTPTYNRTSNSGAWRGPFTSHPWAWRALCTQAAAPPVFGANGVPRLGSTMTLTLRGARASSPTLLITGSSNRTWGNLPLPLDLQGLGAPTCRLHVAFDLADVLPSDASGNVMRTLRVPNSSSLLGLVLHQQFSVVDASANALGLAFSNAGTLVVGR